MASQTGKNMYVAYKVEATFNTEPAPLTGAEKLRINPSAGLNLTRANIQPGEVRSDLMTQMGRLGSRVVGGSYSCDVSVGSFDTILEAIMRSTWVAAVVMTSADFTTITTTTDTIVAASGSWLTLGVRVGDIIRVTGKTGDGAPANNLTLTVKTVVTATITVVGTPLTLDAVADAGASVTILKKLSNAAVPVRRSFYVEERLGDIDDSEVYGGVRWTGFTLRGTPDGMATLELRAMGGSQAAEGSGTSPLFTTPTEYGSIGLVFVDATINLDGGTPLAVATSFELTCDLNAAALPVIGATVTPDIFDNDMTMSGSLTLLREDLSFVTGFNAETEYELQVMLQEPDAAEPKDTLNLFVPRIKFSGVDTPLGGDGAMVQTMPFMVGMKISATPATSGYDQTMMTICTET